MNLAERIIRSLLARAGIELNGSRPWDMQVHDPRTYAAIFRAGSLGLGEAYMNSWWDVGRLDEFFARLLAARLGWVVKLSPIAWVGYLRNIWINNASRERAFLIGEAHYDLGNDFFADMLDPSLTYTCGYWNGEAANLEQAQKAKLDLVCRKLKLRGGEKILDIGCGWGSFARHAAEHYGAEVTGLTVSKEQMELSKKLCQGLPINFVLQDYREHHGQYDHVVSIGMFEAVEYKNHKEYIRVVKRCLRPGGLFLLHTIGSRAGGMATDPWIKKYIFPVGIIPVRKQIERAARGELEILDWHEFEGSNYDRTLMSWHENFQRYWPQNKEKYGKLVNGQFERMWRYYLLSCAGAFRANHLALWQVVLSPESIPYAPVR
ncbi:MAG: cyclopropane fatty acyl phospholipid synthase [Candidatus Liptonbacteria bacterium]|nr:cyclopropane fatty acyl phospholipid synthase [Candidatus Liptonbacteria bacterium]